MGVVFEGLFVYSIGLRNLTELFLFGNNLTELPASIGNLAQLTSLDLSLNHLTKFPASIGNLTLLTKLHLKNNLFFKFVKLPILLYKRYKSGELEIEADAEISYEK